MAAKKKIKKPGSAEARSSDRYAGWLGVMECLELCPPSEVVSTTCARCLAPRPGMTVARLLDPKRRSAEPPCAKCGAERFALTYLTILGGAHLFALNSNHLRAMYAYVLDERRDLSQVPDRFRRLMERIPNWFLTPETRLGTIQAMARMLPEVTA